VASQSVSATSDRRRLALAGGILGFALGGFFDGILLHQVLQWHHFLSLVEGEAYRDIRTQILADGLFHVAVYAVASVGLWLLWRGRSGFTGSGADRRLLGAALLGFGIWQFSDVVLIHWIIGIHRIRVGVDNPLAYDIGWTVVFGVPALIAGLRLFRDRGGDDAGGAPRRPAVAAALALTVAVAGPVAALPPSGATTTMVLFRPGTGAADAFGAVAALDGRVLWADRSGELLAVEFGAAGRGWDLYRHGALMVSSSALVAGCLAWSKV
jgi:uncharacterized membrane protein